MSYLDDTEFATNPDPRCACILLLDTSASMGGAALEALNQGLQIFQEDLRLDPLAQRRVEIAVVTFGNGGIQTLQEFVIADQFQAPVLTAGGSTPMGTAINRALDMLKERKARYQANAIPYYRPWVFMITDGAPTDNWQAAAERIRNEEQARALAFFAVGVENADLQILSQIAVRRPVKLQGLKFREMFLWLSRSQKRVSASKVGEQTPLPPLDDWSMV